MKLPYLLVLYTHRLIVRIPSYAMINKEFTYVAYILRTVGGPGQVWGQVI